MSQDLNDGNEDTWSSVGSPSHSLIVDSLSHSLIDDPPSPSSPPTDIDALFDEMWRDAGFDNPKEPAHPFDMMKLPTQC